MKKIVLWMPTAVLLGSCASSEPLPPHMKFDEAVSKYGNPSHVDRLSDGGSVNVFQRKGTPASTTSITLTFDAAGQCIDANLEAKGSGVLSPSDIDEITRLKNMCYSHAFDAH